MRKVFLSALFLLVLFGVSSPVHAQSKELPYYFPEGVVQSSDSLGQLKEYLLAFQAMDQCAQPLVPNQLVIAENTVRRETDLVSTSSHTKNPAKMVIVLDHHLRMPDGRIRVTTLCGQKFITEHEVDVAVRDLVAQTVIAAKINNAFYQEVTDLAVGAIADVLKMDRKDVLRQLDERVPGTDVTFREYWLVPNPSKESDFIPRELHLGVTPAFRGILGVTWLNTGLVYYNPMARVLDYIINAPSVLSHEMVHANVNLQRFPFSDGLDLETGASIPSMLLSENKVSFSYHGYAEVFRQVAEAYFNFPFEEVRNRVVKFNAGGNITIDAEAYRYYFEELEKIKKEMLLAFRSVLVEYYSKQVFWLAMHGAMGQQDGVFKIMMAAQYDLTNVGGKEATMHLMKVHEPEIFKAAEDAFREQKNGEGEVSMSAPFLNSAVFVKYYREHFSEAQQKQIEAYFMKHPKELKTLLLNPEQLLKTLETISKNENTEGVQ